MDGGMEGQIKDGQSKGQMYVQTGRWTESKHTERSRHEQLYGKTDGQRSRLTSGQTDIA